MIDYLHSAYLWIGNSSVLDKEVNSFLKNIYCLNKSNKNFNEEFCNICVKCLQINQKQHSNIRFIQPEGIYTLSSLKEVFSTISYALSDKEHFFFVLYNVNRLSSICANSLLKSLEEPPDGYHFILLSPTKDNILPTVISRCIIKNFEQVIDQENKLVNHLISPDINEELEFCLELESQKLVEYDVITIIDLIEKHWLELYKKAVIENESIDKASRVIEILAKFRKYPPMPGSAKLALKNLYLNLLNMEL